VIGRNPAAEISIDDQSASWDHARVVARDGSPSVVDLGSSNGTYVNEERVETSLLIPGDRLRIGETVFKVVS
jgi:pSer/pThr/pTyr-binding forkhead associated (FHA) protein